MIRSRTPVSVAAAGFDVENDTTDREVKRVLSVMQTGSRTSESTHISETSPRPEP